MSRRLLKDIPELVQDLKEARKDYRDIVVPSALLEMTVQEDPALGIQIKAHGEKPGQLFGIQDQVHQLLYPRLGIPGKYYQRMRGEAKPLLCKNVNWWFDQEAKRNKKRLVRLAKDEVRAVLSNRYRPIDHLDVLTTAAQATQDAGKPVDGQSKNWALGAKCFNWSLNPKFLDVCFVNPSMVMNLDNLDAGVQHRFQENKQGDGGGTQFVYAGRTEESDKPEGGWFQQADGQDDGGHWVFPAIRIRNSETGFGSLNVMGGLYEAICDNTCWMGVNLAKTHLGQELAEGEEYFSTDTYKKINQTIFLKVRDIVMNTFSPDLFLKQGKKMKGLDEIPMKISEAVDSIVQLPGMTDEIRDEILAGYQPLQAGRETLLDVQRAVTHAAQSFQGKPQEFMLEELGGQIIEKHEAALTI